ncbi:MAG: hypothetical protein ACK52I_18490, partial [Pseudomonadota bacterium]
DIAEPNWIGDDTILKPGDTYSACWPRPRLTKPPTYTVTASDGQKFEVTAPAGAREGDITSFVKQTYFNSTYLSLPDGTEIEFPANTNKETMNRISAQTWNKLKMVIKTNDAAPAITRRHVYEIQGFIYRVRTNRLLTDEEIDAIADANKSTQQKNPFDEFDEKDPRWQGYHATKINKPVAINENTKEVFVLNNDRKWVPPKTRTNTKTGETQIFDGDTWRPSPFRTQKKDRFGGTPVPEDEDISFVVTDNVDYRLRKTSVVFQD